MIALNFTLVLELGLFLVFLGGTYYTVWKPLLRTMDTRTEKIERDRAAAEKARREAQRLESSYVQQLTAAHQDAAHRLQQARYEAHQKGRAELDRLRLEADKEVDAYREEVEAQVAQERAKVAGMIAEVVNAADGKISAEGSLL